MLINCREGALKKQSDGPNLNIVNLVDFAGSGQLQANPNLTSTLNNLNDSATSLSTVYQNLQSNVETEHRLRAEQLLHFEWSIAEVCVCRS